MEVGSSDTGFLSWLFLFGLVSLMYLMIRILHLASPSSPPVLTYRESLFNTSIIKACPLLSEIYAPPLTWGKSGHLQTIIYGKLGRVKSPFPTGERVSIIMSDGATMTYDIFEPLRPHTSEGDYTIVICPGIANSSESVYIRTCVDHAQNNGYRVAVLNHLGAIKSIKLTAPRIFTYGGTDEYGAMVDDLQARYSNTQMIAAGFSMGGNIVTKYLGENPDNQRKFLAGISLCQGYDAEIASKLLMRWENLSRIYVYAMALHQRNLIGHHHQQQLLEEDMVRSAQIDVSAIKSATSLIALDEAYSRRRAGFASVDDYYYWASCSHVMHNISLPFLFLNAADDPIVPYELLEPAKHLARTKDNIIFAETQHGGHLGFFEGNMVIPEAITWLDKIVVQYAEAVVATVTKAK